jgi:hypothetical protein
MIEPVARGDQHQLAQQLVDQARAEGIDIAFTV